MMQLNGISMQAREACWIWNIFVQATLANMEAVVVLACTLLTASFSHDSQDPEKCGADTSGYSC